MESKEESLEQLTKKLRDITNGTDTIFYDINDIVDKILKYNIHQGNHDSTYIYIFLSNCKNDYKCDVAKIIDRKYLLMDDGRYYISGHRELKTAIDLRLLVFPLIYCKGRDGKWYDKWINEAKKHILPPLLSESKINILKEQYPQLLEQMCYNSFKLVIYESKYYSHSNDKFHVDLFYKETSNYWKGRIRDFYCNDARHSQDIHKLLSYVENLCILGCEFEELCVDRIIELSGNLNGKSKHIMSAMSVTSEKAYNKILSAAEEFHGCLISALCTIIHCRYSREDKNIEHRVFSAVEFIAQNYKNNNQELTMLFAKEYDGYLSIIKRYCKTEDQIIFFDYVYNMAQQVKKEFNIQKVASEFTKIADSYNSFNRDAKIKTLKKLKDEIEVQIQVI